MSELPVLRQQLEGLRVTDYWQSALAWCLLALMAVGLASRLSEAWWIDDAAYGLMMVIGVLSVRHCGLREGYLSVLALVMVVLAFYVVETEEGLLISALDQAVFLMSFVLLVSLLHEGASSSPSIGVCGRYLTQQPAGRRFFVLYNGVGGMAVLFNIGLVSLLVPLIQRGIVMLAPNDPLNPIRERRQISALLRGFAWSIIWSPTAIAPLAVFELIGGIDRGRWIVLGLGIFFLMMLIGWAEDRFRFRHAHGRLGVRAAPEFPRRSFALFMLTCGWLVGLTLSISMFSGDNIVFGLMGACPLILLGWLVAQNGLHVEGFICARARLREIVFLHLAGSVSIAISLGLSGFIGRMAAGLIPASAWVEALGLERIPDYVFLTGLPWLIAALSLLALSPIVLAIFFGSLLGSLEVLPADPTLTALAISCGWALAMTVSPFVTVGLLVCRVGKIKGTDLTWRWNGVFSLFAALLLLPVFWLLTGGQ